MVQPTLTVPLAVWQKMMCFVQVCPIEVNGFGYVDRTPGGFYLDDVFILRQTATAASVEVSDEALHQHLYELTVAGEDTGRMRFQWHSHVDFAAYFSSVDTNNIERYPGDWMLSLVANKQSEYEVRLDVFRPFRVWTPLEIVIEMPIDQELVEECQREVRDKVRKRAALYDRRTKPVPANAVVMDASSLLTGEPR